MSKEITSNISPEGFYSSLRDLSLHAFSLAVTRLKKDPNADLQSLGMESGMGAVLMWRACQDGVTRGLQREYDRLKADLDGALPHLTEEHSAMVARAQELLSLAGSPHPADMVAAFEELRYIVGLLQLDSAMAQRSPKSAKASVGRVRVTTGN